MQKSEISTRITSLHGSQTSPAVLCIQNSDFSIRITSLYGSQPSSVVFACKMGTFGAELQVSIGPSPHLRILHAKQRLLDQIYKSLWVPAIICGFVNKNGDFRIRITSLYGSQTTPMVFCLQKSVFSTRIVSLYWSQTSPDGLCMQNSMISTRIIRLYVSQTSLVDL